MNTPKLNQKRYTQERMVGSQKQVYDAQTGRWVSVSMALLEVMAQDDGPESATVYSDRRTGTTTRQMQTTPKNAVFIWCHAQIHYPRLLAQKIGRDDLQIKSPAWLENRLFRGSELTGIVVDHATMLNNEQQEGYQEALARVRR